MPLNQPPIGYTGETVSGSGNGTVKPGLVRFATAAELAATTGRADVALSPSSLQSGSLKATVSKLSVVQNPVANQAANGSYASGRNNLVSGTSATISTTAASATSIILLTRLATNASTTLGELTVISQGAGSFAIQSRDIATPASAQAGDVSTVGWVIIN